MNIQWYPGHMTKTKRMILENLKLVDIVIELVDARIPLSSKNPDIDGFAKNKHRMLVMNKSDLANSEITKQWISYFEKQNFTVILVNSINGKGIAEISTAAKELMKEKLAHDLARGRIFRPIRAMVVGIPNVGKSTFINKLVGKASTKTGDRPGVTKGKQWIKIKKDLELLDTPGILWPKFEDIDVGLKLGFTGAIKDDVLDQQTLAIELIRHLQTHLPETLQNRYGIDPEVQQAAEDVLKSIGQRRGCLVTGGVIDTMRTSQILLDEFRGGKLGFITLEKPPTLLQQSD